MNVATPSNVLSFLLKSHVNTAIYIPTDCTRKIRSIVAHDLLLATQGHIYVNRNYVNPAVKFRYPNAIELRSLKCCICPKLIPRAQEFRTWKCLFCPSRNKQRSMWHSQPLEHSDFLSQNSNILEECHSRFIRNCSIPQSCQ